MKLEAGVTGPMPDPSIRISSPNTEVHVAILIPCLNEEKTIGKVVRDFRAQLPEAAIVVFDNGSVDRTAEEARDAGASVMFERRRGKGFVVQAMFQKVEADIYVMVDGDDTYPADQIHNLMAPVVAGRADMSVGSRISPESHSEFRPVNWIGNKLYQAIINGMFGCRLTDILSGYRCMTRNLVKELPIFVKGFEVETELTIKALQRGYAIAEVPIDLRSRPEGSHSKIHIIRDGIRIFSTIFSLFRDYKPLTFFGAIGLLLVVLGLFPGSVAINDYVTTGLVPHFPSAILAVGLELAGLVFITIGMILHTIDRRFQELEYYMRLLNREQR